MTINYKGLSYKLHEFINTFDNEEKEQLRSFYKKFFFRSKPVPLNCNSISLLNHEIDQYFEDTCLNSKIINFFRENKLILSIAFDFEMKSLTIPDKYLKFMNRFEQKECCEFFFAASDFNNLTEMQFCVAKTFEYIKKNYNKKYIFGNIIRQHKKEKFKKTIQRIFKFTILDDNFTFHEIP